jgi:HlyD family secretion protein
MIRRILANKLIIAAAVVALTGLSAVVLLADRGGADVDISTLPVTRGSVVVTVSATGTLEAVTTVEVGSQVSGYIQALFADFNSIVHKGQLLARIDPTALQAQVGQARASVARAEADVERLKVAFDQADLDLARTRKLAAKQLVAPSDLDAAEVARHLAEVQLESADASAVQARATLSQAEVNLEKTAILSPIDGIVISRDVDVGQTVAASMSAPTLFELAADLTRMRLNASIDESDVGRVKAGQPVQFTVDAFPSEEFTGRVAQVRVSPTLTQNVVSYQTLIDVSNPELKLRPGMTAYVTVETLRRDDVLRVPNPAVRFKPTAEMFTLLGQVAPEAVTMSAGTWARAASAGATSGRVWTHADDTLTPVDVRLGVSDGTYTELLSSKPSEGTELVWSVTERVQGKAQNTTSTAVNPLFGRQPRMRFRF